MGLQKQLLKRASLSMIQKILKNAMWHPTYKPIKAIENSKIAM
ncbi:hypothetical protein BMG_3784 [Priestia megaterium]|nr:hypothetical protein BMG_3784 [Priestia megaterium]